ncbi:MAG: rod shape-determining protein MreD [Spirochaetota bacterium]
MKKYLLSIVLFALFIFFQSTDIYSGISINGINPDFILIILTIEAFILGPMSGQVLGFLVGLVLDIMSGKLLGISAFTYTAIGFGVGLLGSKVYGSNILISIIFLFFATLAKALLFSMLGTIFLEAGYFGYFSQGKVFLEAVMNSLLTPPFFFIITRIKRRVVI